jgi:hypothetical protein
VRTNGQASPKRGGCALEATSTAEEEGQGGVAAAYEGFLQLPQVVVMLVLWAVGVVLLGLCVLVLYWVGRVLW